MEPVGILALILLHFNGPKGGFDLHDIQDVFQKNKNSELINHIFHVKTEARTYSIQAPSITALNLWMACLQINPSELA